MAANEFDYQRLLDLRLSWKIGPSRLDQPELRAEIGDDGWVRRFRVRSASEVLDELIAECIGEVGEETPQEAAARRRDEWIRRFGPIPGSES